MTLTNFNLCQRASRNIAIIRLKFRCQLFLRHFLAFPKFSKVCPKQFIIFRLHINTPLHLF